MISSYEKQYMSILKNIYENGYSDGTNERTGIATKRLPCQVIRVDLKEEFPVLKSKKVFVKSALDEILWIWQRQSNNIKDLKPHIWDEWADIDGSIGKAYGYQIAKPVVINVDTKNHSKEGIREYSDQATFILEYLREFPNGRWANVTLWSPQELAEMNLVPCCFDASFNLDGGRLNCNLVQRSGDMPYGVPFNTTQYAMLVCMFAKDLGVEPGILLHTITDAHIYANQMDGVAQQLMQYELLTSMEDLDRMTNGNLCDLNPNMLEKFLQTYPDSDFAKKADTPNELYKRLVETYYCRPRFLTTEASFFDVSPEYCFLTNYEPVGRVDFGAVAV